MDGSVSTSPIRNESINKNEMFVVAFVTEEFAKAAAARIGCGLEQGAYEKVRLDLTPEEMAFNFAVSRALGESDLFRGISEHDLYGLMVHRASDSGEMDRLVGPVACSKPYQQKAFDFINVKEDEDGPCYSVDGEKPYRCVAVGSCLLVAVKHGIMNYFGDRSRLGEFYRNCLESCQTRVHDDSLRASGLYSKFVAHSLVFLEISK